jgi:hypothetical protein
MALQSKRPKYHDIPITFVKDQLIFFAQQTTQCTYDFLYEYNLGVTVVCLAYSSKCLQLGPVRCIHTEIRGEITLSTF